MKSFLGSILLLLACLAGAWLLVFRDAAGAEAAPPPSFGPRPVAVTVVPVEAGAIAETVELVGDVASARRSRIGFRRAGLIESVRVELGDAVEAGQLLAALDEAVLVEELAKARVEAELAAADAAFAEREAKRAEDVGGGAVSAAEVDRARHAATADRIRFERAQAEVRRLEATLAQGRLVAPFAGVVTERALVEGAYAGLGSAVLELVDLARREVRIQVPARYAAGLPPQAEVRLTADEVPDFALALQVERWVPAADPATRTFIAVVRLDDAVDPERRLLPGMFVRVSLVLRQTGASLLVPADTLRESARGLEVVALGEPGPNGLPQARSVAVELLARGAERVAIRPLAGAALAAGDLVVQTGLDLVGPESLLAPSGATPAAAASAPHEG